MITIRIEPLASGLPEPKYDRAVAFRYDAYFAHAWEDTHRVSELQDRLQDTGLRVSSTADAVEADIEALDESRTYILCASSSIDEELWLSLEAESAQFRDPADRSRRYLAIRLDDSPAGALLPSSDYLDWSSESDQELEKLIRFCEQTVAEGDGAENRPAEQDFGGHVLGVVRAVAIHPTTGEFVIGSSSGEIVGLTLGDGPPSQRDYPTAPGSVSCMAWAPDARRFAAATSTGSLLVWDADLKGRPREFAYPTAVLSLAWSPDSNRVVSGHRGGAIRMHLLGENNVRSVGAATSNVRSVGADADVLSLAIAPDGRLLAGLRSGMIELYDLVDRASLGHLQDGRSQAPIRSIDVDARGGRVVATSGYALQVWDLSARQCTHVLEGHRGEVNCARFVPGLGPPRVVSGGDDFAVLLWDVEAGKMRQLAANLSEPAWSLFVTDDDVISASEHGHVATLPLHAAPLPDPEQQQQTGYSNAKVVLVGESSAGKSGLALRLAQDRWEHTESTLGAWATQFEVEVQSGDEREIWLWDFGGQADQRLIHQLYLGDTALAILVFDGHRDDVVARLWDWQRALDAASQSLPRLLAAGRVDRNPVRVSRAELDQFCEATGIDFYIETSAKQDIGCNELRDKVVEAIDWARIPWRSSPAVFQKLRREILRLKDRGRVLTSTKELNDWLPTQIGDFEPGELDAVIGLLAGPGAVMPLGFGDAILLQPDVINAYAQAVIATLRDDPLERGCVTEERVLKGNLQYDADFRRLPEAEERIVLNAMHRQLVQQSICLRDEDPEARRPTMLVFPSYFRRERPERPAAPPPFVTYRFSGYPDELYASLVVRLHHSEPFRSADLWRDAADFATPDEHNVGIRLQRGRDGSGTLEVHCEPGTTVSDQLILSRYVDEHLKNKAVDFERMRTYICATCGTPIENREAALRRLEAGKEDIGCPYCDERIPLWDDVEAAFANEQLKETIEGLRAEAQIGVDTAARARILVGEMLTLISKANQIAREQPVADYGVDMEVEFKDRAGKASGRRVYLQLKSGDSHLRLRKRDKARIFSFSTRHAEYWTSQPVPMFLVVRAADETIEWMDIGSTLKRLKNGPEWPVNQMVFAGKPLSLASIMEWRDRALALKP